ncbi:MAG: hypothetical protein QME40_04750 [bacterium]|nr:hypothetical protein [bacterium]
MIVDGPPGIGCPVIASLTNVDLALIVTEPTLSGIHDMERVADVAGHFGIHTKVVINKYDINLENTRDIKKICQDRNIEVLAEENLAIYPEDIVALAKNTKHFGRMNYLTKELDMIFSKSFRCDTPPCSDGTCIR